MKKISKKICIIGDFAVGKTSLISRYINNVFSEKYLSTVGVKVDSKEISYEENILLKLMVWDIAGKDKFTTLDESYLKGSSGYLMVADSTRKKTLDSVFELHEYMQSNFENLPFNLMLNKIDLLQDWDLETSQIEQVNTNAWPMYKVSAKTGENVEEVFRHLGEKLLA